MNILFFSMLDRFTHLSVCYNENFVTINIVQIFWKSKNNEFIMQNILKLNNFYIISTWKHTNYEFYIWVYGTQMPLFAWSVSYSVAVNLSYIVPRIADRWRWLWSEFQWEPFTAFFKWNDIFRDCILGLLNQFKPWGWWGWSKILLFFFLQVSDNFEEFWILP